jgi:hypothetical protein
MISFINFKNKSINKIIDEYFKKYNILNFDFTELEDDLGIIKT